MATSVPEPIAMPRSPSERGGVVDTVADHRSTTSFRRHVTQGPGHAVRRAASDVSAARYMDVPAVTNLVGQYS
jgi:hypothetical protein